MKIVDELLKRVGLRGEDAARLVLEVVEGLGKETEKLGRVELMEAVRKVMRAGIEERRREEGTVSLEEAAWASVEARSDLRPVYRRDLRYFVRRMMRDRALAGRPLRAVRAKECREMLEREWGKSPHGYRKARAILHSIFTYGQGQEWCSENPIDSIRTPRVQEEIIEPLNIPDVRRLEATAQCPQHREMYLSLYLMLYCGLRPTEVRRLQPEDIRWGQRVVIVRSQTSKTGGGRVVPLRVKRKLAEELCLIPANWDRRWRALRRAAGFMSWRPDTLRHTFASYHAQYFRNLPALQLEMGHRSTELLRTRYTTPLRDGGSAQFWK